MKRFKANTCPFDCTTFHSFIEVFPKFAEFSDKKYLSFKGLEPAISCIRDQDATTAPTRHMWKTVSVK